MANSIKLSTKNMKRFVHKMICTKMIVALLVIIGKDWKQPKFLLIREWTNKWSSVRVMKYSNTKEQTAITSQKHELHKRSQTWNSMCFVIPLTWVDRQILSLAIEITKWLLERGHIETFWSNGKSLYLMCKSVSYVSSVYMAAYNC